MEEFDGEADGQCGEAEFQGGGSGEEEGDGEVDGACPEGVAGVFGEESG